VRSPVNSGETARRATRPVYDESLDQHASCVRDQRDPASTFMNRVMVLRAQWHEIAQVGWPAMFPGRDVVWLAMGELHRAVRISAGFMAGGGWSRRVDHMQSARRPHPARNHHPSHELRAFCNRLLADRMSSTHCDRRQVGRVSRLETIAERRSST